MHSVPSIHDYRPTQNPCKLCAPLGAALAFKGVAGAMPLLHGSQGCATYIRRYVISHFREPVDIASSSFGEEAVVFGGGPSLNLSLDNMRSQYAPKLIGIATTCLAETIGDDVPALLKKYRDTHEADDTPVMVPVSTPSYSGTHADGFHATVLALVQALAESRSPSSRVNLLPGMASPADLRALKGVFGAFGIPAIVLPDCSQTLDGVQWEDFQAIPPGGTALEDIRSMASAIATIQFGRTLTHTKSAGHYLEQRFGVPCHSLGLPIGVQATDRLMRVLEALSGHPLPTAYAEARGKLVDAYVDGHKYVFGARVVVYGDADLVAGVAAILTEIGAVPVLCATGERGGSLAEIIDDGRPGSAPPPLVLDDADFMQMEEAALDLHPDLVIGSSKGASMARRCGVPLVRIGFPIHDRFGGARVRLFGYEGSHQLFDRVVNALLEKREVDLGHDYAYQ